ncbi:MAG TPA: carboxylesterase family protein [Blastocatellia bacterium]|nr:carboxylesterase family protein [Blastocatellia bacterium]
MHRTSSKLTGELDRRAFLYGMSALGGLLVAPTLRAQTKPEKTVITKTTHGQLRGALQDGLNIFKGVPYAGSPAGENRFKAPPKLKAWGGVRDALSYGPQAMQNPDPAWPRDWKPAASSEDCLFLNVWTPGLRDGKRRPIMFYSHGGGFASGNGGADPYPQNISHDGASLARSYDVVVVTHNHRLNLFGYIYLGDLLGEEYAASGAAGMLDIAAALAWVRENAEAFGGDPNNIMIWGESGGGAKTSTLVGLPAAKGNFHKASIESGATLRLRTKEAAAEVTLATLSRLGLDKSRARELLKVPAEQLLAVQMPAPGANPRPGGTGAIRPMSGASFAFSPAVDGHFIPAHPFDPVAPPSAVNIPILVGTNKDEAVFFMRGMPHLFSLDDAGLQKALEPSLRDNTARVIEGYRKSRPGASPTDLYVAITTARMMWNNAITLAERKVAQRGAPVFMYLFTFESETPAAQGVTYPTKAAHALEIAFKFNHPESVRSQRRERFRAARNMSRAWAAFARTSNPTHDEIPNWPAYTLETRATMFLDAECRVVNDPCREERLLWQQLA